MSWFARLLGLKVSAPVSVEALRHFGEELAAAAAELRRVALRSVTLERRIAVLAAEASAWERRLARAQRMGDPELIEAAARMAGRIDGQLDAARDELEQSLSDELALRRVLIEERRRWLEMAERADRLGIDVSSCVLHIDLSRPPPEANDFVEDDEHDFVASLLDGHAVN